MPTLRTKYHPTIHSMNGDIITPLLRTWEQEQNRPARDIVLDALNAHGTIQGASNALLVDYGTLRNWIRLFGIKCVPKWE